MVCQKLFAQPVLIGMVSDLCEGGAVSAACRGGTAGCGGGVLHAGRRSAPDD